MDIEILSCLADPGEARGCSINSLVINSLINWLSQPYPPTYPPYGSQSNSIKDWHVIKWFKSYWHVSWFSRLWHVSTFGDYSSTFLLPITLLWRNFGPQKNLTSSIIHLTYEFGKVWIIEQLRIINKNNKTLNPNIAHRCEAPKSMLVKYFEKIQVFSGTFGELWRI